MACDRADLPTPARKALNLLADQLVDTQKKIEELTADIRADAKANEEAQRLQTIPASRRRRATRLDGAPPVRRIDHRQRTGLRARPETLFRAPLTAPHPLPTAHSGYHPGGWEGVRGGERPRNSPDGEFRVRLSALPAIADFKSGRDLSAWLGLTPRPQSTGGKERLGRISKMGNRYLRRLLYLGASWRRHAFGVMAQVSARRRGEPGEDWLWKIIEAARNPSRPRSPWPIGWRAPPMR